MPVIKSAKKKLRQDKKRTIQNKKFRESVQLAIKKAKKAPAEKTIREAISFADKAGKKNIFHRNKVARVKAALAKLLGKKTSIKASSSKEKQPSRKAKK